jgi:hypothetical protein
VFPLRALNTSSQKWFAGLRAGPQKYTGRSMKESQHRICNHNGDSRDLTPNSLMIPRARGRAHAPKMGQLIPDAITNRFEQCTWPAPIRESSSPAAAPLKTVPIGARLKQMWR